MEVKKKLKGQAAIFDGVLFLMLVSISVALMFNFAGSYGQTQSKVLRSSHLLNYVHSIGKTLYFVDVSLVSQVDLNDRATSGHGVSSINEDFTCNKLKVYKSNSVAELMKRDLSDSKFDNTYGDSQVNSGNTPGRLALRCSAAMLLKPITTSGYDYNIDVLTPSAGAGSGPSVVPVFETDLDDRTVSSLNDEKGRQIREFALQREAPLGCDGIALKLKGKQILAVTFPFSVFNENDDFNVRAEKLQYTVRICIWPSEKS